MLLTGAGPGPLTRLSQMLTAAHPSMRIHVELSTFTEESTLRQIIERVVQHADSLGLNEQELPTLRRQLVNWHSAPADTPESTAGSQNSAPSVASVLDDARSTFQLLRHITSDNERQFSRLHMHTLAFQVITRHVWMCGIRHYFGSVFEKNSDPVRNEFGLVQFGYYTLCLKKMSQV